MKLHLPFPCKSRCTVPTWTCQLMTSYRNTSVLQVPGVFPLCCKQASAEEFFIATGCHIPITLSLSLSQTMKGFPHLASMAVAQRANQPRCRRLFHKPFLLGRRRQRQILREYFQCPGFLSEEGSCRVAVAATYRSTALKAGLVATRIKDLPSFYPKKPSLFLNPDPKPDPKESF